MDQVDHGYHNPPWWTRTGFNILLMGLQEAPRTLEIVMEKEAEMRYKESGTTNPPKAIRNLQKRKKLMRKNTERLQKTK